MKSYSQHCEEIGSHKNELSEPWETIHLLLFRDRHELIPREEFADGFQRRSKIDPFTKPNTDAKNPRSR